MLETNENKQTNKQTKLIESTSKEIESIRKNQMETSELKNTIIKVTKHHGFIAK
jgi:hypothetical protein